MGISKAIAAAVLLCCAMYATSQSRPAQKSRAAAPSAEDRAADELKDAESLLQKKQYQQAEEKLLVLVKQDSKNPQAWFDLGFAQSGLNKNTDAIAAYKKAVELDPKWFEAQQNLGLALAKSGDMAN